MFDVFISYRHVDKDDVSSLVDALRAEHLDVWIDEHAIENFASIQRCIEQGLGRSKVLLAWYSTRYPESLACQWELTRAFLAGQAEGEARRRVLVVNPESSDTHIHPIELRDARYRTGSKDAAARRATAAAVAAHVRGVTATFEQIGSSSKPRWVGAASGDGSNRFVGRLRELWSIHSGLWAADVPIIESGERRPLVYVTGMAGMGKSLAAETYGIRFGSAYPGGIFWLRAWGHDAERKRTAEEQALVLKSQLVDIALVLGLHVHGLDTALLRASLAEHLGGRPYLWIVDDFPSRAGWEALQMWLAPSASGRSLVTTRSGGTSWAGKHVGLSELDEASALALLCHRRTPANEAEQQEAGALAHDLGYHPLALELAAVAAQKRNFAAFRESLRAPSRDIMDFAAKLLEAEGEVLPHRSLVDQNLSTALSLSIAELPESGRDVLRLASQLAPRRVLGEEHPDTLRWLSDAALTLYKQHDLLAAGEMQAQVLKGRLRTLGENHLDTATAMNNLASTLLGTGQKAAALELQQRAVDLRSRLLGADHQETISAMQNLTVIQRAKGMTEQARQTESQTSELTGEFMTPEHPVALFALNNRASAMASEGNLIGAKDCAERALAGRARVLGADHPDTLATENNLAAILHDLGEYERARALFEDALQRSERRFGPEHAYTFRTALQLLTTLEKTGDSARLRDVHRRYVAPVTARGTAAMSFEHRAVLAQLAPLQPVKKSSS